MKVFELHFNPKKENSLTESFQYKPKDVYEGRLGRLYMVGEINNPEKKDSPFLQNIFHVAKENYYKDSSLSPEQALKETLLELNNFIKEKNYEGKVDIAFVASKNFLIYLTKIGRIKTLLVNSDKIKDIGDELENTGSNLFYNMVSGKMNKSDRLVVLTHEIANFFKKGKIITKLSQGPIDDDSLEKISVIQKEKFPHSSGVALIIDHAFSLKENEKKVISKKRTEKFSFKETLLSTVDSIIATKKKSPKKKPLQIKIKGKAPSPVFPKLKISRPQIPKKNISLLFLLMGVVLVGALIIGVENNAKNKELLNQINKIEEEMLVSKKNLDFVAMENNLKELSSLINKNTRFHDQVVNMHKALKEEMLSLSLAENIEILPLLKKVEEISPDQIVFLNEKLYFFSSDSSFVSIMSLLDNDETLYRMPAENGVLLSSASTNTITLFSPPDKLVFIENESFSERTITVPEEEELIALAPFFGRPYFLSSSGNIYVYQTSTPSPWIKNDEKALNGKLLTIDGSIFIVKNNGIIVRYHEGEERDTINPSIFPALSSINHIYTSPEIPILITDSEEGRIIIINKEGELIKQLFHEKLKDLKDFSVDSKEKKIYLLINEEVYLLNF